MTKVTREGAGAKGFILYARYTSQLHGGPMHLDTLVERFPKDHIPSEDGFASVKLHVHFAESALNPFCTTRDAKEIAERLAMVP